MNISDEIASIREWHKKALAEKDPLATWHVPTGQVMPLLEKVEELYKEIWKHLHSTQGGNASCCEIAELMEDNGAGCPSKGSGV